MNQKLVKMNKKSTSSEKDEEIVEINPNKSQENSKKGQILPGKCVKVSSEKKIQI